MAFLSFDVLKHGQFRLLFGTRACTAAALQSQAVIIGWQIYELTKNPLLLGLSGLVEAVPAVSCAMFAGHIVDHNSPHRIYLMCLGALFLNTLALFCVGGGVVALPVTAFLICAYSAIFISGLARSFVMPSSFSLLGQLVERKDMPAASAWLSSGFQTASIAAPAVAGIVYGLYGALAAWSLPMTFMAIAFYQMFRIVPPVAFTPPQKREPTWQSIKQGWAFLLETPALLGTMAIDMLAVLFGGVMAILPAFATEVLHIGSEGFGLLRAAPAIGAVGMSLLLAMRPLKIIRMTTLLWMVVGFGLSTVAFAFSHSLWLAAFFLALSGMFDSVSMVIRGTLMQMLTPDHMRGRVSSVNSMFIISSNELGAFESGTLAKLMGLVPSIVLGGGISVLVAMGAALSKSLRSTVLHPDKG